MSAVTIRLATPAEAKAVADFCQPIYAAVYPNAKYGLKPEHFSPAIFATPNTLDYFAAMLASNQRQRAYVAQFEGQIVGSIAIEHLPDHYGMHMFYVSQQLRGQGVGKRLFAKALEFVTKDLPIRGKVAETNQPAIDMYLHWGFHIDSDAGINLRHWPEWPEGLVNGYITLEADKSDLKVLANAQTS